MSLSYNNHISSRTMVTLIGTIVIVVSLSIAYVFTRTPSYPGELKALDTLCNNNPQKAEAKLRQYERLNKDMNEDDSMFCRFLMFKSKVKQMDGISDDKEAAALLGYYETEANRIVLQQLYYYVGCVYHILGDVPRAMGYLHQGLSIVPDGKETEQLRGLYYYMLGVVLTYQHLDSEALEMQLKSFSIYRSNHNYQRMIYGSLPISWSLKALGRIKESIGYLNYAKRLSRQYENGESLPLLDCQLADRYYELKEYRLADTYISSALRKLPDAEKSSAYTIAANISAALGNTEKAKSYCDRLLDFGTVYSKQTAYRFLAEYYKSKGDMEKAYGYCMAYSAVTDTIVQVTASEYSAKANAMFNYKFIEKEKNALLQSSNIKGWIAGTSLFVAVVAFLLLYVYWYRNRKRQRKLDEMLIDIRSRNEHVLEQKRKELEDIRKKLDVMSDEKSDIQQQYQQQEMQLEKLLEKNELLNKVSMSAEALLMDTPIYKNLKCICRNKGKADVDWSMLEDTLYGIYPTFRNGMTGFKRMKEQAYHVCLLIKAGFNVQEIGYLTMKTDEAINSTRRRLYEANFGKKGKPSEWDDVIRSL